MAAEYKSEERIDYMVDMTPEETKTKNRQNLKNNTSEQRERRNQWCREYRKNMTPEQKERRKQYIYEYKKNMTLEQKERHKKYNHEYKKNMTPEQKERLKLYYREYRKKITPEKRETKNKRARKNKTPEQKARIKQYDREYKKNMTHEMRERRNQLKRHYFKNMTPEQRERTNRKTREYRKQFTPEQRERINKRNRERYKKNKQKTLLEKFEIQQKSTTQNVAGSDQNIKDRLFFCYTCRQQFMDNTNLLNHITMHVSQPYVVVSKIDEFEKPLIRTEVTNKDMEIQKRICDNILTNTVHIKSEMGDDFKEEETEIDIDEFPYCIPIKTELNTH